MCETTSSFPFSNIQIWGRINCGMVKITKMTRIADLITPFNSLHKVFEILLLILSLCTTWWRFMPPYGTSTAENISRPRTFSLDVPEGYKYAESTRSVLGHMAGFTSTPRERFLYEIILVCHLPLLPCLPTFGHSIVSKVICSSNSFVYCAISFSPRVFLLTG
jgi:hypothetical protein